MYGLILKVTLTCIIRPLLYPPPTPLPTSPIPSPSPSPTLTPSPLSPSPTNHPHPPTTTTTTHHTHHTHPHTTTTTTTTTTPPPPTAYKHAIGWSQAIFCQFFARLEYNVNKVSHLIIALCFMMRCRDEICASLCLIVVWLGTISMVAPFITHFITDVITRLCWDLSYTILVKRAEEVIR